MLASDPAARKSYGGTMGTAILKAFDLAAACTGLNEAEAQTFETLIALSSFMLGRTRLDDPGSQAAEA